MIQPQKVEPPKLFEQIERFIAESTQLLQEGAIIELSGLDDHVRALCEAVLQLSQQERVEYADKLQSLLGDLNALGETLVAQRDQIGREISGLARHKKANTAYTVVEASDRNNKEE